MLRELQASAKAVLPQGCDVPGYDLAAADEQVGLDPLGDIGIVQHRIGIPGGGLAAALVKGQPQILLQRCVLRMAGQVLRQQEAQCLQGLRPGSRQRPWPAAAVS